MTYVKVGENTYSLAEPFVKYDGTIRLTFGSTVMSISQAASIFGDSSEKLYVLDDLGETTDIYSNYSLYSIQKTSSNGSDTITVLLMADLMSDNTADILKEQINELRSKLTSTDNSTGNLHNAFLAKFLNNNVESFSNDELISMSFVIPEWAPGVFNLDDVRTYEGIPYKCVSAHDSTSNPNWYPPAVPALWSPYHAKHKEFALIYQSPSGVQDAYNKGEWMVWSDGLKYCCEQDGTVWGPDIAPSNWTVEG